MGKILVSQVCVCQCGRGGVSWTTGPCTLTPDPFPGKGDATGLWSQVISRGTLSWSRLGSGILSWSGPGGAPVTTRTAYAFSLSIGHYQDRFTFYQDQAGVLLSLARTRTRVPPPAGYAINRIQCGWYASCDFHTGGISC